MLFLASYRREVPQRGFGMFLKQFTDLKVPIKGFLGGPKVLQCRVVPIY